MKRALGLACLSLVCALAPLARADSATAAQLQYELGVELYKQKQYTGAIERFIASHRLVPNANVVLNIVQIFEFLKRDVEAYNWNETLISLLPEEKRADAVLRRDKLQRKVAVVDVVTTPAGAELFVDRVDLGSVGRSPLRVAVQPGERTLIARLEGHADRQATVTVALSESRSMQLDLPPLVGTVTVNSTPAGARVSEETTGRELGRTPGRFTLPMGEQRVVITLPGHVTQSRVVRVVSERDVGLSVRLERAASSVSVLTVRGNVDGARVMLDGLELGVTPLTLAELTPGTSELAITTAGHEPWSTQLTLEPGAATRVEYELVDPQSRTWGGWSYVGYGLGGALLATGAIVGLRARSLKSDFEREPSRETLDSVRSHNLAADILFASGIVVAGATVVWDVTRAPAAQSSGKVTLQR